MNALVSPTDRDIMEQLGDIAISSQIPEQNGADILLYTSQGMFGIQRKRFPEDFVSSMNDGRLARETSMLKEHCKFRLLIIEGIPKYYPDGNLVKPRSMPGHYTRKRIRGTIYNIRYVKGIDIDYTESLKDTVDYIKELIEFFTDTKHLGLYVRPSAPSTWIVPSSDETLLWVLQGFSGVGPQLAENIIKHFGDIPIKWTCTLEDLKKVPRLGNKVAEEIYKQLGSKIDNTKNGETSADKINRFIGKKNG
jgi:Fanconi anemia group M protein